MAYFYPRALARLRVPVMGTASERLTQSSERTLVEFELSVKRARVVANDFNQADECSVEVTYDQIGTDPRLLSNAILKVYMGDAQGNATYQPQDGDLRFVGIVSSAERMLSDTAKMMSIKALDYTTIFIAMKPYPVATGAPTLSQTLREAWATICDHIGFYDFATTSGQITSSVSDLRERIRGEPDDSILDRPIGSALPARLAAFGTVQIPHEADGWAAWRACVESLGLLTWIDVDGCVVSQAPDYYSSKDPAVFVYGANIKDVTETRDVAQLNGKGIHLTSFDPLTGQTLESFFPKRNDRRVVKKRLTASKKQGKAAGLAQVTDYEHQTYPYPCTQDSLDDATQRVWEERSRQELEGRFQTSEMTVPSAAGQPVDVLGIRHGDQVAVKLDDLALDEMRKLPTVFARSYYLLQRGFPPATASLIARDQGYLEQLLATFFVKEVTVEYDSEAESFVVNVAYCSRINPSTGITQEDETEAQAADRQAVLDQLENPNL